MKNADEMIAQLEDQIKEEEQKGEHNDVEESIKVEQDDEVSKEDEEEGAEEAEEETVESEEEQNDETEDSEVDESSEGDEEVEKKGSAKNIRKSMKKNFDKIIKEKDQKYQEQQERFRQLELELAEQKGFKEALQKEPEKQEDIDAEPDPILDPEDHMSWEIRNLKKQNEKLIEYQKNNASFQEEYRTNAAISQCEQDYKQRNPDINFENVKSFIKNREQRLIKLQYPNVSQSEIDKHFKDYEKNLYVSMANQNMNAADVIVKMAQEYGYEENSSQEVKKRPNFANLQKNRKKNSSLIGGSDVVKEHSLTPEALFKMTTKDLLKGGDSIFDKAEKSLR